MAHSNVWHALLIFGSTFVLEDLAVLGAALLVLSSMVSLPWAAASSFAGIWLGDVGLYLLALHYGRPVLDRPCFRRVFGRKVDLGRSEMWFRNHGTAAIVLSRVVPGTRLPTYLAAGLLKVPAGRFLSVTGVACAVWVIVLFAVSYQVGARVVAEFESFRDSAGRVLLCAVVACCLAWLVRSARFKRMLRWEFWPPAVFYLPVATKYLMLAIRYRSFSLPTLANPGMLTGGLIGESKYETLRDIARVHPEFVPETCLVRFDSLEQQVPQMLRVVEGKGFDYPVVCKPDVGQRGFGFKVVRSADELRSYAQQFSRDTLIQKYVPGPYEAGIFYYRLPSEERGRIFAITEKVFPAVVGDGTRTLEGLILNNARASLLAQTYLRRFAAERSRVLRAGEVFRLVEAGNHCQGAVFLNGARLRSGELERRIDEISRGVEGFYVGRYDIRYSSEEGLRSALDFQIIELNGASSEATAIYDPQNSLWNAYRTLFRQWEIVFAIGNENRRRGSRATPLRMIWRNWVQYQRQVALHPLSD